MKLIKKKTALTGIQTRQPVKEPEFRAMRQEFQSGIKIVHCLGAMRPTV